MRHCRVTALVSCVAGKRSAGEHRAKDLYTSTWFEKARRWVERRIDNENIDDWWILSAKHELTHVEEWLKPYEDSLVGKTPEYRRGWAERVAVQCEHRLSLPRVLVVLAGEQYRQFLLPLLRDRGFGVVVPMQGLGIGSQLGWLDRNLNMDLDLEALAKRLQAEVSEMSEEDVARAVLSISAKSEGSSSGEREKMNRQLIADTREQLEAEGRLEAVLAQAGLTPVARRKKKQIKINWDAMEEAKADAETSGLRETETASGEGGGTEGHTGEGEA